MQLEDESTTKRMPKSVVQEYTAIFETSRTMINEIRSCMEGILAEQELNRPSLQTLHFIQHALGPPKGHAFQGTSVADLPKKKAITGDRPVGDASAGDC